ncbi:MAG: amidase [Bdellovibrionales bacterium]
MKKRKSLLEFSARKMSELVRTQQISPVELVEKSLQRLELINPSLNARAEDLSQQALTTARDLENKIFSAPEKYKNFPLLGVPVTVKEMFAMKGCLRTAGSLNYKNEVMDFDSTLVTRLKSAGAIPICTTNVPELGLWFETENILYGRTRNPYDLKRTSGGSTGGDAALIASLVTPLGLGSDIGGSVRIPAAFCGVYGHKPTWRRLPKTGHFPSTLESIQKVTKETDSITTMGFLTREVEDLTLLMETLSGPDQWDPTVESDWKTKKGFALDPQVNKIFVMESPKMKLCAQSDQEVSAAVKTAAESFRTKGFEVHYLESNLFVDAFEIWSAVTGATQGLPFYDKLTRGQSISLFKELSRHLIGHPRYTFPALITCVLDLFKKPEAQIRGLEKAQSLHKKIEDLLGENNFLLMPVHPRVAPRHAMAYFRPFDFCMTGFLNPFGIPATSIPAGLNSRGLPLAVQIVAGFGQDHINFAAADFLDKIFGGYKKPSFNWLDSQEEF